MKMCETDRHSGHFAASSRAWLMAHSLMQSKLRGAETDIHSSWHTARNAIRVTIINTPGERDGRMVAGTQEAGLCGQMRQGPEGPLTRIDAHTLQSSCTLWNGTWKAGQTSFFYLPGENCSLRCGHTETLATRLWTGHGGKTIVISPLSRHTAQSFDIRALPARTITSHAPLSPRISPPV